MGSQDDDMIVKINHDKGKQVKEADNRKQVIKPMLDSIKKQEVKWFDHSLQILPMFLDHLSLACSPLTHLCFGSYIPLVVFFEVHIFCTPVNNGLITKFFLHTA